MDRNASEIKPQRLYLDLLEYTKMRPTVSFKEYETAILKDICLFNMPNDEYLSEVEATLDCIIKALPYFKRIFSRPIIRLKDEHHIIPVESVNVIDKRSLTHIASRCELWENVTTEGIKPRKLMTLEHIETYSIYENIAFAYAVDTIFDYIDQTLVRIKDIVYGCRDIHFNLLDKTHHRLYFLAIGKLYLEYVSSSVSKESCSRCIDKMVFIERTLRLKLNSPVYQRCKRRKYSIKLKKTNIFRSHKDYAEVYNILKRFEDDREISASFRHEASAKDEEYRTFCKMLTVFAASHFNYELDSNCILDINDFRFKSKFLGWELQVEWKKLSYAEMMIFTTKKELSFTTCVIFEAPTELSPSRLSELKQEICADEYLFCSPNVYGSNDLLYLSVFDIDSFRRIQQILLRGMIWSDTAHDTCAFCGNTTDPTESGYHCSLCLSAISQKICPETNKTFFVSDILYKDGTKLGEKRTTSERRRFLHDRLSEAQLHFRNITPITPLAKPVCPYCNKAHDN